MIPTKLADFEQKKIIVPNQPEKEIYWRVTISSQDSDPWIINEFEKLMLEFDFELCKLPKINFYAVKHLLNNLKNRTGPLIHPALYDSIIFTILNYHFIKIENPQSLESSIKKYFYTKEKSTTPPPASLQKVFKPNKYQLAINALVHEGIVSVTKKKKKEIITFLHGRNQKGSLAAWYKVCIEFNLFEIHCNEVQFSKILQTEFETVDGKFTCSSNALSGKDKKTGKTVYAYEYYYPLLKSYIEYHK